MSIENCEYYSCAIGGTQDVVLHDNAQRVVLLKVLTQYVFLL